MSRKIWRPLFNKWRQGYVLRDSFKTSAVHDWTDCLVPAQGRSYDTFLSNSQSWHVHALLLPVQTVIFMEVQCPVRKSLISDWNFKAEWPLILFSLFKWLGLDLDVLGTRQKLQGKNSTSRLWDSTSVHMHNVESLNRISKFHTFTLEYSGLDWTLTTWRYLFETGWLHNTRFSDYIPPHFSSCITKY